MEENDTILGQGRGRKEEREKQRQATHPAQTGRRGAVAQVDGTFRPPLMGSVPQRSPPPRLAVRAVIVVDDRLLIVNAWAGRTHLWCAPGGGVEAHASLPDNLEREVHEETGLSIHVGPPCLVNELHDPGGTFHQVEVFFRCRLRAGVLSDGWRDPEGVVTDRRWVDRAEAQHLATINALRPASLPDVAFGRGLAYDPLEAILR